MKLYIEFETDEHESNIGFAKALIDTIRDTSKLREISRYLAVYCEERQLKEFQNNSFCSTKGGVQE